MGRKRKQLKDKLAYAVMQYHRGSIDNADPSTLGTIARAHFNSRHEFAALDVEQLQQQQLVEVQGSLVKVSQPVMDHALELHRQRRTAVSPERQHCGRGIALVVIGAVAAMAVAGGRARPVSELCGGGATHYEASVDSSGRWSGALGALFGAQESVQCFGGRRVPPPRAWPTPLPAQPPCPPRSTEAEKLAHEAHKLRTTQAHHLEMAQVVGLSSYAASGAVVNFEIGERTSGAPTPVFCPGLPFASFDTDKDGLLSRVELRDAVDAGLPKLIRNEEGCRLGAGSGLCLRLAGEDGRVDGSEFEGWLRCVLRPLVPDHCREAVCSRER